MVDPIELPRCGNTLCRYCATFWKRRSNGKVLCPTCREDHNELDLVTIPRNHVVTDAVRDFYVSDFCITYNI